MAKRKQAAEPASEEHPPAGNVVPAESPPASPELPPAEEESAGRKQSRLPDPHPIRTVDIAGYMVRFQMNRRDREMQIKFGDGTEKDKPSDAIRAFVKQPDGPDGVRFRWHDEDRAWGMRIDSNRPASSRQKAEAVFDEVLQRLAQERGQPVREEGQGQGR